MADYKQLCADLVDALTAHAQPDDDAVGYVAGLLTCARAALAEPEQEGPTLDEIDDLCAEHSFCYEDSESLECLLLIITDALARWGNRSAPQPIPVSERVQQIEDLATDAVCGLRYIERQYGRLYGVGWDRVYAKAERLFPANTLPQP